MASFWIEFEQAGQTRQVPFEKDMVSMGRDRGCDFVLDHPTVSRQHAMIVYRHGSFLLVVQSRGGLTAVEGQPAQTPEVPLYDGSMITLGQYSFRFRSQMAQPKPAGMAPSGPMSGPMGSGPMGASPMGSGPMGSGPMGASPMGASPMGSSGFEEEQDGESNGAGIMSWDEIAASSEAMDEVPDAPQITDFERLQAANKKKEGMNPVVVGGVGFFFVLVVGALFLLPGNDRPERVAGPNLEEQVPVEISVACLDQSECRRDALAAYARAEDLIESRDVETGNLFEAYKRLLEAQAYLQEGGISEMPSEMADWQRHHDSLRAELDSLFASLRMRYHQASSRERTSEMRDVIRTVQAYFPDRTSREYRQARAWQLDMQSRGLLQPGDL